MFTLTVTGCPAVTRQVATTTSHSREAATARQLPAPLFAFFQFCFRGYFFYHFGEKIFSFDLEYFFLSTLYKKQHSYIC